MNSPANASELILVLGGARSGKSAYAEHLAYTRGGDNVLFVATAEALDHEMQQRIQAHRRSRPPAWRTLEVPREVAPALKAAYNGETAVVVDCITLLVANILGTYADPFTPAATQAVQGEIEALLETGRALKTTIIFISNEVGWGLVPTTPLGRAYRDLLGWANQRIAQAADEVYLLVAGIALPLKTLARRNLDF